MSVSENWIMERPIVPRHRKRIYKPQLRPVENCPQQQQKEQENNASQMRQQPKLTISHGVIAVSSDGVDVLQKAIDNVLSEGYDIEDSRFTSMCLEQMSVPLSDAERCLMRHRISNRLATRRKLVDAKKKHDNQIAQEQIDFSGERTTLLHNAHRLLQCAEELTNTISGFIRVVSANP